MAENVIEIEGLKKSFGNIAAVDDLSFKVKRGELFAFLGVNGAGKSTTISIICGSLCKDGGKVMIAGEDADRGGDNIKRRLGVVFQESTLDKPLSVKDNLMSRAALYGIRGTAFDARFKELDRLLELSELSGRPAGKLSGGQRRRADIARALLHDPEILILDEPTTGLDPQTRKRVWQAADILRKERGLTVFLTTHYMEEAAEADYVVILDGGKKAAEGTPLQLKNAYAGDYVYLYGVTSAEAEGLGVPFTPLRDGVRLTVKDTSEAKRLLLLRPELFKDFEIIKGRMDDVFLAVTGKNLREEGR